MKRFLFLATLVAATVAASDTRAASGKKRAKDAAAQTLPRIETPAQRAKREFRQTLAVAMGLQHHGQCPKAYQKYLELSAQHPNLPDVVWGLAECGGVVANMIEDRTARAAQLQEVRAAYERYRTVERRLSYRQGTRSRVAHVEQRIAQLDLQIAEIQSPLDTGTRVVTADPIPVAIPPAAPPKPRVFPRTDATPQSCRDQVLWNNSIGFDRAFWAELFSIIGQHRNLEVGLWLPTNRHEDVKAQVPRVFAMLKDAGTASRYGFSGALLSGAQAYLDQIVLRPLDGQTALVTFRTSDGVEVTIARCEAVRGALQWTELERERRQRDAATSVASARVRDAVGVPAPVAIVPPPPMAPPAIARPEPPDAGSFEPPVTEHEPRGRISAEVPLVPLVPTGGEAMAAATAPAPSAPQAQSELAPSAPKASWSLLRPAGVTAPPAPAAPSGQPVAEQPIVASPPSPSPAPAQPPARAMRTPVLPATPPPASPAAKASPALPLDVAMPTAPTASSAAVPPPAAIPPPPPAAVPPPARTPVVPAERSPPAPSAPPTVRTPALPVAPSVTAPSSPPSASPPPPAAAPPSPPAPPAERATDETPERQWAKVLERRGDGERDAGQFVQAVDSYAAAYQRDPTHTAILPKLAMAADNAFDPPGASRALRENADSNVATATAVAELRARAVTAMAPPAPPAPAPTVPAPHVADAALSPAPPDRNEMMRLTRGASPWSMRTPPPRAAAASMEVSADRTECLISHGLIRIRMGTDGTSGVFTELPGADAACPQ